MTIRKEIKKIIENIDKFKDEDDYLKYFSNFVYKNIQIKFDSSYIFGFLITNEIKMKIKEKYFNDYSTIEIELSLDEYNLLNKVFKEKIKEKTKKINNKTNRSFLEKRKIQNELLQSINFEE